MKWAHPVKPHLIWGYVTVISKHPQDAHRDARLSDYITLAEQDYLRGWTDCEEGIRHEDGKSEAYNAGYADCYEYENQGDRP
jgi:hypothetical protein